ncbi:MAG TPA: non-ribosomal peptide synthase/polyketide synthase [Kofleriaceae bacterium]
MIVDDADELTELVGDDLPLSHMQQRFWVIQQLIRNSSAYNLPLARRLRGPLDAEALRLALERTVGRHDALRTVFPMRDGMPRQAVRQPGRIALPISDLSHLPTEQREAALAAAVEAEIDRPFDLSARPPWRVRIVRIADDDHVLVFAMHHIIADPPALDIFWRDLTTLYARGDAVLEPVRLSYPQFTVQQRERLSQDKLERQLSYWTQQLAGTPPHTNLPYRGERPRVSTAPPREIAIDLDPTLSNSLRELAQRSKSSLFMVGSATVRALLARTAGQHDLGIGVPISTRNRPELNDVLGVFVNTIVLRSTVEPAESFRDLVKRERATALAAYSRSDVPFDLIVQTLGIERSGANPLFQVSYAHQDPIAAPLPLGPLATEAFEARRNAAQFDLEIETWDNGASIQVRFIYKQDLFDHWAIAAMADQFVALVRGAIGDPDMPLSRIPLFGATERTALLAQVNADEPVADTTIAEMFESQVARTPHATALVLGDARRTFRQLDERANQIAAALREHGVGPEVVVGIALARSFELVAAILGVTKAGGAWVPLDPKLPGERLLYIAQASQPRAIVSAAEHDLPSFGVPIIDVASTAARAKTRLPPPALSGDSAAYLIFTSGSTGKPKGVIVPQRAIINELVRSSEALGALVPGDAFLQLAPYTFDQSVHEMLWPLVNGATVVLVEEGDQRDPAKLVERIQTANVTILDAVPTLWRALLAHAEFAACSSLRLLVAGGEALPLDLVRAVNDTFPDVPFLNGYGPTEAAISVGYWHATRDATTVAIGTTWRNVQFYVLDDHLEPVPLGVGGELYLGGRQLARGYASRPDLTGERFVPDPFARAAGQRLYRTGDRVRRRPDGTLEFLGRVDDQVKLRGFRIELGEIESALRGHDAIKACAVLVVAEQLVAYFVAADSVDAAALRAYLADRLPDYMVPAAYVLLDEMPLTASGKLNRNALPAPDESTFGRAEMIAPRTDEERAIAAIWCEVLDVSEVGVRDNFFALGGHSLLATRVVARIRAELEVEIALQHLFDTPTVESLAAEVKRLSGDASPVVDTAPVSIPASVDRGTELPLSYAQQRLWLVDRMVPDSSSYHMPSGKRIRGVLDVEALRGAFEDVVRRHEILRTTFPAPDGLPHQVIHHAGRWELPLDDLAGLSELERHNQLHRISREDAERPFDLATGPLLRTRVVRLEPTDHVVLVTMHHIISDGWSYDVFWQELSALYDGRRHGRPLSLAPLPLQYADFAIQQREALGTDVLADHLAYWKQQLAGAPEEIALPRKVTRPSAASGQSGEVIVELDKDGTRGLREFSQREGVTVFMSLLAVFRAVLARTTGQDDIVIGTPIANRNRKELERLIGLFVNTLVLRTEVDRKATVSELVRRERETILGAFAHQDAPFEMIVDELAVERRPGRSPLFQVWFVQENASAKDTPIDRNVTEEPFLRGGVGTKFDLAIYINEIGSRIELALVFNADIFDRSVIDGIAQRFVHALEVTARAADRPLSDLDFGPPPDNVDPRVALAKPAYPPVLEVVEELARAAPDAPALRSAGQTLTRSELWSASSTIAGALTKSGISPGDRVALAGPPSAGLVAAYLAILRTGACLVPLSSRLSRENADRLLALADARVVLQISGGTARAYARVPSATIDPLTCAVAMPTSLAIPSRPTDPAVKYIYFTSGTTGAQKGVIGNLVALGHFSAWQRSMFGDAAGPVSAQLTELGFDVFLRDTMFALTAGKMMAMPPKEVTDLEPGELLRWMEREHVSAVHTVPSLARTWLKECPPDVSLRELRCLFVVGEPLDATLVERWRARFNPATEFINLYGTTETGPAKSWYRVAHPAEPGVQPAGWPLPETQILLMRDAQHLAAAGEVGEVVIRTPFSTLGYLEGARSDTSFYPNPFRSDPTDILYRTGDLGRQRSDGALEILGRADDQVKIRGQRVDPPGIAAVVRAQAGVMDAAVLAHKLGDDDVRLVAYVVRSQPPPSTASIREHLRQTLPPYMVPGSFVFLDALPKKPNGKLDRDALPAPDWDADADAFVAPRGPEEEAIAGIWCEVLQRPRVSVRDDFFALGGHSLLAVQVTSRVRALFDVQLAIQRFFEAPTVEGMAAEVIRARASTAPRIAVGPIEAIARSGDLPLSFAQQRMWFLHRLAPTSPAYSVPLSRRMRGALVDEALRRSFEEVVRRHESLRSVFPSHGGMPRQEIRPPQRWELPVDDLSTFDADERARAVERLVREEAERPFDIANGPLLRTRILRLAPDDHLVLVTLHHITSDGWSMGVLWTEVAELYRAYTTGVAPRLAALPLQYADYAAWQRRWLSGETLAEQLSYWTHKLADAPSETALPLKGPRPAVASSRGGMVSLELDADVVKAMRTLGRKTGATQFVTLLAAFRAVLARTTGQTDVSIGAPIANRNRAEVEGLIGLFLNTLVLRTEVDPAASFEVLVKKERATALGAYAHQDAPFEMIVDALKIERSLNITPLFNVSFVHQNMPQPAVPIGELVDEVFVTDELTTRFDLSIVSFERDQKVVCELIYNAELFDRWQIEQLAAQYGLFLREALRDPTRSVDRIPVIAEDEQRRLLVEWNQASGTAPSTTIPALFEAQVDRTPDVVALTLGDDHRTYRELDERANRIAWDLRARGVGPEVTVGIALERSFDLIAAILGVSKAGGAWVPMDPHLPSSRLDYIASIAAPRVVIASLDETSLARQPAARPPRDNLTEDNLAYVLFTSGSTGRPKGVMISHRGIVNELVSAQTIRAQLDARDAFLQLAPYTFDLSVHEILWPLTTGARLVLLHEGDNRDPRKIAAEIRDRGVTIMHPVPTLLRALLADDELLRETRLRVMCSGGEPMPLDVLRTFISRHPGIALINSYGPTEASVTVSQWRARPDATAVAVGLPWLDTQLYVLDARLEPVPLGVSGELYIGGRQVGRGYASQPALTAERFVPDPFASTPGQRLYRTGDRARRWPDGNIEVIGRVDNQVKLRGFRIELGEIDAVLREHADVREAVVTVDGTGSDARLVAFIVSAGAWSVEALRVFLAARLPEYMVPRMFVRLDAMPLNPSGKLDRGALPAVDDSARPRDVDEPPRTPLEELLAGIWSELLGVDRIGREDNFFDIGGHSLLAARLAWETKVSIATVFAAPTLSQLAAAIEASQRDGVEAPPITPAPRGGPLALSYAQQRMWFLNQLAPTSPAYHIAIGRSLRGALDTEALRLAFEDLVARHEVLRSVVPAPSGIPHQELRAHGPWALPVRDISASHAKEQQLERISREERERPFDLARGPLVRTVLIRTAPDEHVVFATFHHIVADGWSIGIFWHDLEELYSARVAARASTLARLPIQYADYAAWQRSWLEGDVLDEQLAYWKQQLGGAPEETALPIKGPRPPLQTHHGASLSLDLDHELLSKLRALSNQHGCTLFITLLAGFRALLSRYTGQNDLCIGAPTANRTQRDTDQLIGLFVNTLVLRTPVTSAMTFSELLTLERATALAAFSHADAPFEMVVEALGVARSLSRNPLFQVMFQVQHGDDGPVTGFHGLTDATVERGLISTHVDLDVSTNVRADGADLVFVYNTDLFDETTIANLAHHLRALLAAAVADPEAHLGEFPLLSPAETSQLVHGWNDTAREVPARTLPELVDERAAAHPDAIAIVGPTSSVTYAELVARSNRLARDLVERGLAPEERVAIRLERGPDLVIAMLGVLKAGGAYLPIDSELPADRIAYMTSDAGVRITLTQAELDAVDASNSSTPLPALSPHQLAYVLYTSGSTGRPKGVHVQHGSLVNFLVSMLDAPGLDARSTMLAVTTASFDISGLELYLPLLAGARVVITSRDQARDAVQLQALLAESGATMMQATPATWQMLVESGWAGRPDFVALCGGEALPPALATALTPRVAALWNLYGPTETTIWSARKRIVAGTPIRLGEPIANTSLYILDTASLTAQPFDVAGELFIGGAGLARGYGGRPDLTSERFLPDPFSHVLGARMYRTGDRVRRRANGEIEFLGRIDHQVKIRGFRIELGEIEAVLSEDSSIAEVVVVVRDDGGEQRLVAYVVTLGAPPATDHLLAAARERLPDYMVPSAVVFLDELPLSTAGKIDRRALPAPDRSAFVAAGYHPPRGPIEEILAGIWADLLRVPRVGAHDNFFDLGGHSLLAVRLLWAVNRAFSVELALAQVFTQPTVAELATAVAAAQRTGSASTFPPITPADRSGALPLSYSQQRMWFLHQLEPSAPAYNIATGYRFHGPLDAEALRRAFEATVHRHEPLRTVFPAERGVPRQVIREVTHWDLPVDVLEDAGEETIERLSREESRRPFDLGEDLPFRTRLLRVAPDEHVVFATMHHIVTDGWSSEPFWADVMHYYVAFSRGESPARAALPVQYADYAAWQRRTLAGDALDQQLAYWKRRLLGAPHETALPFKGPRPARQTFTGAFVTVTLERNIRDGLAELARRQGATIVMALLAGIRALFYRYTGQQDLVIGVPTANRNDPAVEHLVGLFMNTVVMRSEVRPDATFAELVASERSTALEAFAHQDTPFEMVVDALGVERALNRNPLFQTSFQAWFEQGASTAPTWGDVRAELVERTKGSSQLDLEISAAIRDEEIELAFLYNVDLFDHEAIVQVGGHLRALLRESLAAPEQRISQVPLLSAAERSQLLDGWNATERHHDRHAFVPTQIEAQVDRTPDAIAVAAGAVQVTYRELDERANRLAHQLIAAGVRVDQPVGVLLERSPELVVTLLAILKAGGAFVPLDVSYPVERLRTILVDAGVRHVVGESRWASRIEGATVDALWLDEPRAEREPLSSARPQVSLDPKNLAYVLFTSGSTGRPKGVMIDHGGLENYLAFCLDAYPVAVGPGMPLHSSLAFDLTVTSVFAPLLAGTTIHLIPDSFGIDALVEAMRARPRMSVLKLTPTHLELLARAVEPDRARDIAACLVVGGEQLTEGHLAYWRQHAPQTVIFNEYGPTEAVVGCCVHRVGVPTGDIVPIGHAIANTRLYILDRELQPVPGGVAGELFIAGAQLARGYSRRPDLTADRFLPDPFHPGERMYRTGDLARLQRHGAIEYLGRIDHQVKLRGFRIELGEIEAALRASSLVSAAVVVLRGEQANAQLVAYVVPAGPELDAAHLKTHLQTTLPPYMVPNAFVPLERLPLTVSGKVDHKALPAPDFAVTAQKDYVAPRTEIEAEIAAIWAELLRLERVGVHDDFFDLGGHSLLALRVVAAQRSRFELEIPLRVLFEARTVERLAREISSRQAEVQRSVDRPLLYASPPRRTPLPASLRGVFRLAQSGTYNRLLVHISSSYFDGDIDVRALERALKAMRERHAILRTTFFNDGDRDMLEVQEPAAVERFAILEYVDLSALAGADLEQADAEFHEQVGRTLLDIGAGQVITAGLSRWSPTRHRFTLVIHNIASDADTMTLFANELYTLWRAFTDAPQRDPETVLPPLALQYHHLADYLDRMAESEAGSAQRALWRERISGMPPLKLPIDLPRSRVDEMREANDGVVAFPSGSTGIVLEKDQLATIERIAMEQRASVVSTIIAALAAYLSPRTSQRDLAFVTRLSQRYLPGLERALGFLVNPLVLRVSSEGDPSFRELVDRAHTTVTNAFDHAESDLLRLATPKAFRFCVVYNEYVSGTPGGDEPSLPSDLVVTRAIDPVAAESQIGYDLMLFVGHRRDSLTLNLLYNKELFFDATGEALLEGIVDTLTTLCRAT